MIADITTSSIKIKAMRGVQTKMTGKLFEFDLVGALALDEEHEVEQAE